MLSVLRKKTFDHPQGLMLAVRKALKKGETENAVEKAVSQGMANGAKKKPVGKAAAAADAQEAKTT
jgi:hypothetical protein